MKLKKFSSSLLALVLTLGVFTSTAMASTIVDGTLEIDKTLTEGESVLTPVDSKERGSISIELEETSKKVSRKDVKLNLVRVADVVNGEFILLDTLKESGVDLNSIKSANELEVAASKLKEYTGSGDILVTDENGLTEAKDLETGVYLIYPIDTAKYDNISPLLVSIPTMGDDGLLSYDIKVLPKHTPKPEVTKPAIPQTGYESNIGSYALAFIGFLACFGIIFFIGRKFILKDKK